MTNTPSAPIGLHQLLDVYTTIDSCSFRVCISAAPILHSPSSHVNAPSDGLGYISVNDNMKHKLHISIYSDASGPFSLTPATNAMFTIPNYQYAPHLSTPTSARTPRTQ